MTFDAIENKAWEYAVCGGGKCVLITFEQVDKDGGIDREIQCYRENKTFRFLLSEVLAKTQKTWALIGGIFLINTFS